ncbi:MAG: penicillin acylase family protein [Saprospiraceae bacterium]|nr:penicillin acylase family protein [Saprospiraceae bacterium]
MRILLFGIIFLINVFLVLFLNGNITLTSNPLPPLGKFLNPFGGAWTVNASGESGDFEIVSEFLKEPVMVKYDDRRVPHIFAQNLEDALFAQGYVEAQNRLFQMEFASLAAAGELSSVLGDKTLEIDREKRRRGMRFAAENAVKGWEQFPEQLKILNSYSAGVNYFIDHLDKKEIPFEFKLLDFEPSEWTLIKSALIFKQMSLTLAGRNDDIKNTNLINTLGQEDFHFLYPETEDIENPIIPESSKMEIDSLNGQKQDSSAFLKETINKVYYESRNPGIGSNSWALSGIKTASGKPIFCNDPHLGLGLPSIWFELHIHTPQFNSYGVSFPGMPGIMIGFNENIAWGETNVGQDVEDLFLIKWVDKQRSKYFLDGSEVPVDYRIEKHKIKGAGDIIDTLRYTYWGPVYHESNDGQHDLAMRWLVHDIPDKPEFMVFVDAMSCNNYENFLDKTANFITPAQNFGFASKEGDIAVRVNGKFPAKYDQDGRFVEYGDNTSFNWQTFYPRQQNPQMLNPERGFIATANQRSADKTFPYYYTGKFEHFRNKTINGKLDTMLDVTIDDMKKMQFNTYSSKAADAVPLILNLLDTMNLSSTQRANFEMMKSWDFQYLAQSEAPVFFEMLFTALEEKTWDEIIAIKNEKDVLLPKPWRLIALLKTDTGNKFFDHKATPEKETAPDIVNIAFESASSRFNDLKSQGSSTTWGEYRPLDIFHLMRLPALSVMNLPADGCPDAINAVGLSFGPSWRMIVNMEDRISAYGIYPGGQSGNPTSKYYSNMIQDWMKGQYYPLRFVRSQDDINDFATQSITFKTKK